MSNAKKLVLIFGCVFLALVGMLALNYYSKRIAPNPAGTLGNTAGNLNNGGYFCETQDRVYFANAYDNATLYSMNPDETDIKKINTAQAAFINSGGDYLYYYQKDSSSASGLGSVVHMTGLYRCKLNGRAALCLDKSRCNTVVLMDNTLYYERVVKGADTRHLYGISIDKKNQMEYTTFLLNPASASNGGIYYNGTVNDHYLYYLDTETGSASLVYECDMWFPTLCDNYIYYLDTRNNYQLCRYSLASGEAQVLTTDRVDSFNVYGSYIYYQKNDAEQPALMRMYTDGTNPEEVASGNYSDINITSQYVYFHAYGADTPVFHTPTSGPVNVTRFDNARAAAIENMND